MAKKRYRATKVYYGFYLGKGREFRGTGYGTTKQNAQRSAEAQIEKGLRKERVNWVEAMKDNISEDWKYGEAVQEVEDIGFREIFVKGSGAGMRKGSSYVNKYGTKVTRKAYYYPGSKGYYKRIKVGKGEGVELTPTYRKREYSAKDKDKGHYPVDASEL